MSSLNKKSCALFLGGMLAIQIALAAVWWADRSGKWTPFLHIGSFICFLAVAAAFVVFLRWSAKRMDQKEAAYHSLFQSAPIGVVMLDPNGSVKQANTAIAKMYGYSKDEMGGKQLSEMIHHEHTREVMRRFELALQGEVQTFYSAIRLRTGYSIDVWMSMLPLAGTGETSSGVVVMMEDITRTRLTEERIKHMSYYDDLTGLPNRRLFRDAIAEYLLSAEHLSRMYVILINIDRFKHINSWLGQDAGDVLLLQVADRINRVVNHDGIAARMEGDEFGVLYRNTNGTMPPEALVERLQEAISETFVIQQFSVHISVSMGIARGQEGLDEITLLRNASMALSKARDGGKSGVEYYTPELDAMYESRFTLEYELRQAIYEEQFQLVYQPQVRLKTGEIVGSEVLLRWNHPTRGMISPGEFIPLAEETGLIVPISEWVIRQACLQNRAWQEEGLPAVPVAVNLSVRHFMQPNVAERIAEILEETGLAPEYLEIEITETMMMDEEYASSILAKFKELGVRISVDDFGTGYSSLSYLKNFPVDKLKIDRTFVGDIMNESNDGAIVRTIITMGHLLRYTVIAEGVETEEQLKFLRENGCDELQGYIFSPPLTAEEMRAMLAEGALLSKEA